MFYDYDRCTPRIGSGSALSILARACSSFSSVLPLWLVARTTSFGVSISCISLTENGC